MSKQKKPPDFTAARKRARAYFSYVGTLGGHARAKALTPERRSEIARNAINARWARYRKAHRPDE